MRREAREAALDSRLEILIHHRLVSLVLGLNSHVYSLAMICILLNWKQHLGIQKPCHVRDEQRRILVLRPVIGIRIEDELRVGQVLLKRE